MLIMLTLSWCFPMMADANWKKHPTFDEKVTHVMETSRYVYFTSANIEPTLPNSSLSLFRFDKEGEEIINLSTDNLLSGNLIKDVVYNPEKGYLFVLYNDGDIDLIYNDGATTRIPYYAMASTTNSKKVNGITIDPSHDRVYLATDFGYVAINDKKNEIAESRIYGETLGSFGRMGDYYVMIHNGLIKFVREDAPRFDISDFRAMSSQGYHKALYPVGDNICVVLYTDGQKDLMKWFSFIGGSYEFFTPIEGPFYNFDYTDKGLIVTAHDKIYQINAEGEVTSINIPADFRGNSIVSDNLSEFWCGVKRKGLASIKNMGDEWSLTRDYMMPNAPAVSFATSFVQHPQKGLLMLNYGYNPPTYNLSQSVPLQLSSHLSGRWQNHSPAYTNPSRTNICNMSNGIAIDPERPELVYVTSLQGGLIRLNLNDPTDIIHMSRANDNDAGNDGFIPLLPTPDKVSGYANFSAPRFDADGNMWMNYTNWNDPDKPNPHLYCWLAEDRKATTNASNAVLPKLVEINSNVDYDNRAYVVPLLKTGKGLLLHVGYLYEESLILLDTNNTPTNTSDDKVYRFNDFYDTDGNSVEVRSIRFAWEDPTTGYVWLGHRNGLCYFLPSQVLAGNYEVNRVKVSRNDGTNLADYLLEGVTVNNMTADSQGRKWFATNGGGVICTTADAREIVMEFNSSNSPLPSDAVFGITYDSAANSILFSTSEGIAEYFLPMDSQTTETSDIRAYPNPVRPEFSSYVTITDIPEGSLVKIVDATGNLVKDLGRMSGFEILWDISDTSSSRVKSGVYYILVSPGNEYSSFSKVGKILVIS